MSTFQKNPVAPGASIVSNSWAVYEEVNGGATLAALFIIEPSADFFIRAVLAKEVYDTLYRGSQSFEEDNIGSDTAYLLGAILKNEKCEWDAPRPFIRLLSDMFKGNHAVWNYINIIPEDPD